MNRKHFSLLIVASLVVAAIIFQGCATFRDLFTAEENAAIDAALDEASRTREFIVDSDEVGNPNLFVMIIASDAQYPRSLINDPRPADKAGSAGENTENYDRSKQANEDQAKSMNTLIDREGGAGVVQGVIVNGDLTEYGESDHLDVFTGAYGKLKTTLYPGLGNHDIANNLDCYNCIVRMVQYQYDAVKARGINNFDAFRGQVRYGSAELQQDYRGSLAYSWDVNNVHFVQLNNYPTYEFDFSHYVPARAQRYNMYMGSALEWFDADCAQARNDGKAIVVNFHDWSDHFEGYDKEKFIKLIKKYQVSAIFTGHIHSDCRMIDSVNFTTDDGSQKTIPVFRSGSAFDHTYLITKFTDSMDVYTMKNSNNSNGGNKAWLRSFELYDPKPNPPLPVPGKPGVISFFNETAAICHWMVEYNDGTRHRYDSGDKAYHAGWTVDIPSDARWVHVFMSYLWGPWVTAYDQTFSTPPNLCLTMDRKDGDFVVDTNCP